MVGILSCITLVGLSSCNAGDSSTETSETTSTELSAASQEDVITLNYSVDTISEFYTVGQQDEIQLQLDELKEQTTYSMSQMLLVQNPYQTNTTGLYAYFESEEAVKVSYTIHVEDETIGDFEATLYNPEGEYATVHEYQFIGLVPGTENNLSLTMTTETGNTYQKEIVYTAPTLLGDEETILDSTDGESTTTLTDGLFVILGNDSPNQDFMYYYDNDGVIRGEIPIISYRSHRIVFDDEYIYFSIATGKIAQMDRLGRINTIYNLKNSNYNLHHDYVLDDSGNLLILATDLTAETEEDRVEDQVISLNLESGEVTLIADFSTLLPEVYSIATGYNTSDKWDPIHFNTIQYAGDDAIILSSRETSAIIKLSDIYDTPTIDYMLGDELFWEETSYQSLLFNKSGDFDSHIGQHTVTYEEDSSLEEGQYYLYLFSNNVASMTSYPEFDWSQFTYTSSATGDEDSYSSYYKYLVDEETETYQLVDSLELPYSAFVSSVQLIENNLVFDSGMQGIFGEYDSNHTLVRSYTMALSDSYIYRVYKYTFENFYFAAS